MKNIKIYVVATALLSVGLSSCQKKFDASTYAPKLNIGGFSSSNDVAKANLVAHWSFDGNLIDSVSNTAAVSTGTGFSSGVKGSAFQGATNSFALAAPSTAVANLQSFTLTEWIKTPPPSTGVIGLFSLANTTQFWGNLEIFIENGSTNDNGKLRIHMFNGADDKTFAVDGVPNLFDKFVNIAVSYDAATGNCKLYLNSSKIKTATVGGLTGPLSFKNQGKIVFGCVQFMTTPSQTTSHGSEPWASYLTGNLDEVRIYNKALSDDEVSAIVKLEGRGK